MPGIPTEIRDHYGVHDVDVCLFVDLFDEPLGSKILCVGAHDESTANMLSASGFNTVGIDLRPYDERLQECNYDFFQGDFCTFTEWNNTFDVVVALSCIEHFGMGTYGDKIRRYYDVVAMRQIWNVLKPGGKAYVTVPVGGHYLEVWPHWRVYDLVALYERLAQDFKVNLFLSATAGPLLIDGRESKLGEILPPEEVAKFSGIPPHISSLLILEKV